MYTALKLTISHGRFGKAYEVCLEFELKNCGQGIKRFVN